jgi:hypothetical protein
MTYAFTDTVQIEEGFEIPTMLDNELSKVDLILWESYHIGGGAYTLEGENEWATELAVQGILEGKTPDEIAKLIADECRLSTRGQQCPHPPCRLIKSTTDTP